VALGDQINFRPEFQTTKLPCSGKVGDLIVVTPLKENEPDPEPQGSASVCICLKANDREGRPAVWARVQFDGIATCETVILPLPPQDRPRLERG
jgi:hypothetical protein